MRIYAYKTDESNNISAVYQSENPPEDYKFRFDSPLEPSTKIKEDGSIYFDKPVIPAESSPAIEFTPATVAFTPATISMTAATISFTAATV